MIKLNPRLYDKDLEKEPMKKGYGNGLLAIGRENPNVVAASTDEVNSTGTGDFASVFPDRFFEIGIAEQNLVGVCSGLAAMGKIPYAASYGAFSPGRNWEQIKTTICINDRPVKLIGTHVGLSDAPDGATHQMLEDIALMRVLPNMIVIAPCDSVEASKATMAVAHVTSPTYIRIARDDTVTITTEATPFEIGKAQIFLEGTDITIVATGRMTYQALLAAKELAKSKISVEVIHSPTIKPLDRETILKSVKKTDRVLVAEEAQINGGLGGAVAELLGEEYPVPMKRIGVNDRFGQSGSPDDLFEFYGLSATHIVRAAQTIIKRKAKS